MAAAAVQYAPSTTPGQLVEPLTLETTQPRHDVTTILNYYKDPGDGSLPAPTYVG
jgi:hypothetical protein